MKESQGFINPEKMSLPPNGIEYDDSHTILQGDVDAFKIKVNGEPLFRLHPPGLYIEYDNIVGFGDAQNTHVKFSDNKLLGNVGFKIFGVSEDTASDSVLPRSSCVMRDGSNTILAPFSFDVGAAPFQFINTQLNQGFIFSMTNEWGSDTSVHFEPTKLRFNFPSIIENVANSEGAYDAVSNERLTLALGGHIRKSGLEEDLEMEGYNINNGGVVNAQTFVGDSVEGLLNSSEPTDAVSNERLDDVIASEMSTVGAIINGNETELTLGTAGPKIKLWGENVIYAELSPNVSYQHFPYNYLNDTYASGLQYTYDYDANGKILIDRHVKRDAGAQRGWEIYFDADSEVLTFNQIHDLLPTEVIDPYLQVTPTNLQLVSERPLRNSAGTIFDMNNGNISNINYAYAETFYADYVKSLENSTGADHAVSNERLDDALVDFADTLPARLNNSKTRTELVIAEGPQEIHYHGETQTVSVSSTISNQHIIYDYISAGYVNGYQHTHEYNGAGGILMDRHVEVLSSPHRHRGWETRMDGDTEVITFGQVRKTYPSVQIDPYLEVNTTNLQIVSSRPLKNAATTDFDMNDGDIINAASVSSFSGIHNVYHPNGVGRKVCEFGGLIATTVNTSRFLHMNKMLKTYSEVECCPVGENNPCVYGIFVHRKCGEEEEEEEIQEIEKTQILSIGEGLMWVLGPFKNGDLITSSNKVSGYGMVQDDDLYHSYTVAKVLQSSDDLMEMREVTYDQYGGDSSSDDDDDNSPRQKRGKKQKMSSIAYLTPVSVHCG